MKRIYTKTGDKGTTGIHGGKRVPKDDIRIEANGTLDELNAMLGIARAHLSEENEMQPLLYQLQQQLMVVMSHVATPEDVVNPNEMPIEMWTEEWEVKMDEISAALVEHGYFILPGGTKASSFLQYARTIARRAERRLWTLHRTAPISEGILKYVNRLSDLLFVLSRKEMQDAQLSEEKWQKFSYKSKLKRAQEAE